MVPIPLLRGGEPYQSLNTIPSAISEDEEFLRTLLDSPNLKRPNIGPIPTCRIAWDQPHEGKIFEHLYEQRAIQRQPTAKLAAL